MPECRDCAAPIQFLPHPKTGKSTPYDDPLPPPPNHYQSKAHIDATRKNGAKPKKGQVSRSPEQVTESAKDSPAFTEAKAGLERWGYKPMQARAMLKDIPEAAPEDMVLAALTKMGATKGAK